MIYGKISDLAQYRGLGAALDQAIDWVLTGAYKDLPQGKTEIDGSRVFVTRSFYETKPSDELIFEAHEQYGDIHLVLSGEDEIQVSSTEDLQFIERREGKDFAAYQGEPESVCVMRPGYFLIVFAQDAHRVKVMHKTSQTIEKAVVKFLLS